VKVVKSFIGLIITDSILAPLLLVVTICTLRFEFLKHKMLNAINELKISELTFNYVLDREEIDMETYRIGLE
jgi:hypothetical protein